MNLSTMRSNIRTMLSLSSGQLLDADINRAVDQATSTLSRFFPREVVAISVYNESVDDETFTSNHGTAVTLANKPIRFGSEIVATAASGGTSYTKDTDYEIDYINGKITTLSSGSIVDSTTTYIDYKMDATILDVSSLMTEPINILRVETLTVENVPREFDSFEIHGDFLIIVNRGGDTQRRLVDNEHIRVWYLAYHDEPTDSTNGSFPRFLDELVVHGAAGYALLIRAMYHYTKVDTDLVAYRDALVNITPIHFEIDQVIAKLVTAHGDADTALDTVKSGIQGATKSILSALDSATTEIASANTELDKAAAEIAQAPTESNRGGLELDKMSVESAFGNTELDKAAFELEQANSEADAVAQYVGVNAESALDKVATHTGDADTALDLINTELLLANDALDLVPIELTSGTRAADKYLDTGDALINTVNLGRDAAAENREYAIAKVAAAQAYIAEASGRVEHAGGLAMEAVQRLGQSESYINEALGRMAQARARTENAGAYIGVASGYTDSGEGYLDVARSYGDAARGYISVADSYLAAGVAYITSGRSYTENALAYIAVAEGRYNEMLGFLQEANGRLTVAQRYIEEIAQYIARISILIEESRAYQSGALQVKELADTLRQEADSRIAEFIRALEDRAQIGMQSTVSSSKQHAQYR